MHCLSQQTGLTRSGLIKAIFRTQFSHGLVQYSKTISCIDVFTASIKKQFAIGEEVLESHKLLIEEFNRICDFKF